MLWQRELSIDQFRGRRQVVLPVDHYNLKKKNQVQIGWIGLHDQYGTFPRSVDLNSINKKKVQTQPEVYFEKGKFKK